MGLNLLRGSSKTFMWTWASRLTKPQCHTRRVTVKVERSNGMTLQGLKPRIFNRLKPYARKWVKELPSVLWALHTTPSHATDHTPFSLVYSSKAMLPTEVEHKSFRVQQFNEEQLDDSRVDDLTRLEEYREATVI
jgi:hypothetical protein